MIEHPIDVYDFLINDFEIMNYDEILRNKYFIGLRNNGYTSLKTRPVIEEFDAAQIAVAQDVILAELGRPAYGSAEIGSYGLKHLIERNLSYNTKGRINYISNGAAIFAMIYLGYKPIRENGSPNADFKVSARALKRFMKKDFDIQRRSGL